MPVKIFSYGGLPPVENAQLVDDQLRRAHRYRNALVEIEKARREAIAARQRETDSIGPLLQKMDEIRAEIEELRKQARAARAAKLATTNIKSVIASKMKDLVIINAIQKWAKAVVDKIDYSDINEKANRALKEKRADKTLAPYWGTYLLVEAAMEASKKSVQGPRFYRYDGTGRIGVQIQNGMTVSDLLSGEDSRLRITGATPRPRQKVIKESYKTLWIRIGSEGKNPIWAKFPMVLHRPLPEDARIKQAWVHRTRIGIRYKYTLQFTIEAESFTRPRDNTGPKTVAIDIGTRDEQDDLFTARWKDANGNDGEEKLQKTRLSSPTSHGAGRRKIVPNTLEKVTDLQEIRDKNLDKIKVVVAKMVEHPEWDKSKTRNISSWRSPARVAIFAKEWKASGLSGNEEIQAYLKQDRHLLDWQSNERRRYLARRDEQYKVLAANLARQYATIVIAARDYRREKRGAEEGPASEARDSRKMMRSTAPGKFREFLDRAAKKYGANLVEIPVSGDTAWALDPFVCDQLLAKAKEATETRGKKAIINEKAELFLRDEKKSARQRRLGNKAKVDPFATEEIVM